MSPSTAFDADGAVFDKATLSMSESRLWTFFARSSTNWLNLLNEAMVGFLLQRRLRDGWGGNALDVRDAALGVAHDALGRAQVVHQRGDEAGDMRRAVGGQRGGGLGDRGGALLLGLEPGVHQLELLLELEALPLQRQLHLHAHLLVRGVGGELVLLGLCLAPHLPLLPPTPPPPRAPP